MSGLSCADSFVLKNPPVPPVLPNGCSSEGGPSHEKHIKMAVLDNQAKIQQVQPKYREVNRKKSFEVFFEASVYSEVGVFGSTICIRKF